MLFKSLQSRQYDLNMSISHSFFQGQMIWAAIHFYSMYLNNSLICMDFLKTCILGSEAIANWTKNEQPSFRDSLFIASMQYVIIVCVYIYVYVFVNPSLFMAFLKKKMSLFEHFVINPVGAGPEKYVQAPSSTMQIFLSVIWSRCFSTSLSHRRHTSIKGSIPKQTWGNTQSFIFRPRAREIAKRGRWMSEISNQIARRKLGSLRAVRHYDSPLLLLEWQKV